MDQPKDIVKLQHTKLNINDIVELVQSSSCGAISTFIGTTRDNFENKKVVKLEYEAYEPMALKEMRNLCGKVRSQWDVERIAIFHRLGEVPVLEASVAIAISSPHRKESLQAVQDTIDMLKATVPIWKKEIYTNEEAEWKENKECAWSSCGISVNERNNAEVKVEALVKEEEVDLEENSDATIDPSMVQVRASNEEISRRIQAFIARKREQVNQKNIQEFCFQGDRSEETEDSCARVDAILTRHKDSKSHMKVHRVMNPWGPQTANPSTLFKTTETNQTNNYPPALEERLSSTEKQLGIDKPVPPDIYERLKQIEDRVFYLESISPEYKNFWMAEQSDSEPTMAKPVRKRTFSTAELDTKLHELEDRYAKKMK